MIVARAQPRAMVSSSRPLRPRTPFDIPGVRRLIVHVEHDRGLHLIEDVSNGQAFRDGVRLRRSPRILRESHGMITIDVIADAGHAVSLEVTECRQGKKLRSWEWSSRDPVDV
jgi:hypothetical protein